MTIGAILERYEVPAAAAEAAVLRGAYARAVQAVWLGPEVSWPTLVKALVFAELGSKDLGATVRKKVGLDKYATTIIARGTKEKIHDIARGHDWHQKLYVYCGVKTGTVHALRGVRASEIIQQVEVLLLGPVDTELATASATCGRIRDLNVLHYKNPSV